MRKKLTKERCTKLWLDKCEKVCYLYDKVQRAWAEQLQRDEKVKSFQVNVPLDNAAGMRPGGWQPPEMYTTDFVIVLQDGTSIVREAAYRQNLDKASTVDKLEYSRRYWLNRGISDWGIIVEREDGT